MQDLYLPECIAEAASELKAQNIVILDLREQSAYADFLVIASGTSDRHVQAIAHHIEATLTNMGQTCLSLEGIQQGEWALIDFGHIVVHIFHPFTRETYDFENLWHRAKRTLVPQTPQLAVSNMT